MCSGRRCVTSCGSLRNLLVTACRLAGRGVPGAVLAMFLVIALKPGLFGSIATSVGNVLETLML